MVTFGQIIRELRKSKGWTLRQMAPKVGISFTYLSKVETGRLDFGDYPSESLIHRLAEVLKTDEEELLILADKVPQSIRKRMKERPEAFRTLADLDDSTLDEILIHIKSVKSSSK